MSDELAPIPPGPEAEARTAERSLRGRIRIALIANDIYLDLAPPTNAQVAAQVKALTRQVNALIRLFAAGDLLEDDDASPDP